MISVPETITEMSALLSREVCQKSTVTTAQSKRAAELASQVEGQSQSLSHEHLEPLSKVLALSLKHLSLHAKMHDACHAEVEFLRQMLKTLLPEGDALIERLNDLFPCEELHACPIAVAEAEPVMFLNAPVLEPSSLQIVPEATLEEIVSEPVMLSGADEAFGSSEVVEKSAENPFDDHNQVVSRRSSGISTGDITENVSKFQGITAPEAQSNSLDYTSTPDYATGMKELEPEVADDEAAVTESEQDAERALPADLKSDIEMMQKDRSLPEDLQAEVKEAASEPQATESLPPNEVKPQADTPQESEPAKEVEPVKQENPWFKKSGAQVVKEMAEKQPSFQQNQPLSRRTSEVFAKPLSRKSSYNVSQVAPVSRSSSKQSVADPEGWVQVSRRSSKRSVKSVEEPFFADVAPVSRKQSISSSLSVEAATTAAAESKEELPISDATVESNEEVPVNDANAQSTESVDGVALNEHVEQVPVNIEQDAPESSDKLSLPTSELPVQAEQESKQQSCEPQEMKSESEKSFVVLENAETITDSPWMADMTESDMLQPQSNDASEDAVMADPLIVDHEDMKELELWNPEQKETAVEQLSMEEVVQEEDKVDPTDVAPKDSAIASTDDVSPLEIEEGEPPALDATAIFEPVSEEKHVTFTETPEVIGTQAESTKHTETMLSELSLVMVAPVQNETIITTAPVQENKAEPIIAVQDISIVDDQVQIAPVLQSENVQATEPELADQSSEEPLVQNQDIMVDQQLVDESPVQQSAVPQEQPAQTVEQVKSEQPSIWQKFMGFVAPSQKQLELVERDSNTQDNEPITVVNGEASKPVDSSDSDAISNQGEQKVLVDHSVAEPSTVNVSETEQKYDDPPIELIEAVKVEEQPKRTFASLFAPRRSVSRFTPSIKSYLMPQQQVDTSAEDVKVDEAYVSKETSPVDDKINEPEPTPVQIDELNFRNIEGVSLQEELPYKDVPDYATGLNELEEPSASIQQRKNNPWFQKTGSRVLKESIARDTAPDFTLSPFKEEPTKSEAVLYSQESFAVVSPSVDMVLPVEQVVEPEEEAGPVQQNIQDEEFIAVKEPYAIVTREESKPVVADRNPFAVLAEEELAPLNKPLSGGSSLNIPLEKKDSLSYASDNAEQLLRQDANISDQPVKRSLSDLMDEIKKSDSINDGAYIEDPVLNSTEILAQQEQAREDEPDFSASTIADSEDQLNKKDKTHEPITLAAQDPEARMQSLDKILDECIDIVREDAAKTQEILCDAPVAVAVKEPVVVESPDKGLSPEQVSELLANPFIPESVKDTIRKMQAVAPVQPRSAASYQDEIAKLKKENADLKSTVPSELAGFAEALEQENTDLAAKNHTMLVDNQKLQAALADVRAKMSDDGILSTIARAEKHQLLDLEALNLIARLKKIWKSLMVLYLEDVSLPEIQSIAEVGFILDQIEISIQIVSSHVDGVKA